MHPPIRTAVTRYHVRGTCILIESMIIKAIIEPVAMECIEIFHQNVIKVTIMESRVTAKINDLIIIGTWKRKVINEVMIYSIESIVRGIILSLLSSI